MQQHSRGPIDWLREREGVIGMLRRGIVLLLSAQILVAVVAFEADAVSLPHPPKPKQLTVSGFVIGRLAKGNKVRFGVIASDPLTWADLQSVKVALILRGHVLEEFAFLVKDGVFQLGDRPPVPISSTERVTGGFFRVNPHTVRMIRHTFSIDVTLWAVIREGIPHGTTFRVIARSEGGRLAYAREKVSVSDGFLTWGTFAIGVIAAFFVGGFVRSRRYQRLRKQLQPSIWDVLDRRLKEERVRPSAPLAAVDSGAA